MDHPYVDPQGLNTIAEYSPKVPALHCGQGYKYSAKLDYHQKYSESGIE